jgi:hypothetical protein
LGFARKRLCFYPEPVDKTSLGRKREPGAILRLVWRCYVPVQNNPEGQVAVIVRL